MKPLCKHLKRIALFLAITFLVQSCKVYTYKPTSVNDAVKSGFARKVKVKTNSNETFIFDRLEHKDGVYYGIAKKESATAKNLSNQILYQDDFNYVKISLTDVQFKQIYVKKHDKTLSTIVTILVPVTIIGGLLAYAASNITLDWSSVDLQIPGY